MVEDADLEEYDDKKPFDHYYSLGFEDFADLT